MAVAVMEFVRWAFVAHGHALRAGGGGCHDSVCGMRFCGKGGGGEGGRRLLLRLW